MLNNLHVLLCLSLCLSSSFSFFFEILLSHNAENLGKFEKSSLLGFYDFGRTFFATCTVAGFLFLFLSQDQVPQLITGLNRAIIKLEPFES